MRIVKRSTLLLLMATALFLFAQNPARAANTYYSQCTGCDPNTLANWNTNRAGGGISPANFIGGDIFVIQNGHSMTTSAVWSISGSGSKLWIENGGTLTATSAVTLATATTFQVDGGATYVHNNTTAFGSTIFQGTESFDAASTVIINNSSTTGPSSVTFGNLTLNYTSDPGGAVSSAGGLIAINGDFTVISTSSREFRFVANSPAAPTITIAKDLVIQGGTLILSSGTSTPTVNLGGNFNQTGGTLTTTGVSAIVFTGGSSSVTFTQSAGTLTNTNINWQIVNGKTVTFNNAFTIASSRSMTVDAGGTLATAATFSNSGITTVNGTFQINTSGSVSGTAPTYASASTLKYNSGGIYNRSTEWSTTSGAGYPGNVQLSNNTTLNYPNGSTTARSISGNLTIDSGSALYMDYGSPGMNNPLTVAGNLTLNGALSLGDANGGDLYLGGNWNNNGTFNPNNRAVFFNGSGAQTTTGATTFDYLTLNNSAGLTLNNDVTVDQTLTLTNGKLDAGSSTLTLDCSGSISGASSTKYILGNLKKNYCTTGSFTYPTGTSNGYSPVAATLTALTTNPSSLQIKCVEGNPPGLTDAKSLDRYWSLTATGDLTTNLTFTYLAGDVDGTESDYRIFRGTTEVCDATCVNEGAHTATISGVTQFSNWTMGEANAPTSASLVSFKAKLTPKHKVKVKWETGVEMNVLGFNLYRQTVGNKKWVKVNGDGPIDAQKMGLPEGAHYTRIDKQVKAGKTYRYKLEVLLISGPSEWSQVIKVTIP